jgi:hypothetical protein
VSEKKEKALAYYSMMDSGGSLLDGALDVNVDS